MVANGGNIQRKLKVGRVINNIDLPTTLSLNSDSIRAIGSKIQRNLK